MKLLFLPYSRSLYNFIEEFDFTCNQEFGHGGRQGKELGGYFFGIPQSLIGGSLLRKTPHNSKAVLYELVG